MRKTYQFRLKPTRPQEQRMHATLNACRFVYNLGIADRRDLWERCGVSTSFNDQCAFLPKLKKMYPFLKSVHAHTLQHALKRVDTSFQRYWDDRKAGKKHGYPRFKGRHAYTSFTFKEWENGAAFDGKRLSLSKIGRVRINLHRPIEGVIKTCTIKRQADGWYALFSVELQPAWRSINESPAVGIDLGLVKFATLSDGVAIENPRYLMAQRRQLEIAQRKTSNRRKGSVRRRKAADHLALKHLLVSRQRKDFHFKTAKKIVDAASAVCVENLNIRGMVKNHRLAKHISDASWGRFLEILSRSAESAGVAYMAVEARWTSQACSRCGYTSSENRKTQAEFKCLGCGHEENADINAAKVILAKGLGRPIGEEARSKAPPKTRETIEPSSCGVSLPPQDVQSSCRRFSKAGGRLEVIGSFENINQVLQPL